jgi:hypothetical protein
MSPRRILQSPAKADRKLAAAFETASKYVVQVFASEVTSISLL